ncbi:hypothetical protein C8R47DRAFT_1158288 [Mycena vitilis]|nr:hypothetical protein C8R47DRAFT_1158288 [Mycena vitilis]
MVAFNNFVLVSLAFAATAFAIPAVSIVGLQPHLDIKLAASRAAYALPVSFAAAASGSQDVSSDHIDLFDAHSTHIGRYAASDFFAAATAVVVPNQNCNAMTPAQVKLMRGSNILLAQPFSWDGRTYSGFRNIYTANQGGIHTAFACTGPGPFNVTGGGEPSCSEYLQVVKGVSTGNTGTVTATYTSGSESSLTLTTTRSSEISTSVEVSIGVQIKIFSGSTTVTRTETIQNENSKTTQDIISVQNSIGIEMIPTGPNSVCELKYNVQSCTSSGIVKVPFIATGWIAVEVCVNSPLPGPDGIPVFCGEWAIGYLSIDANLPEVRLRSSEMELRGTAQGKLSGEFTKHCT